MQNFTKKEKSGGLPLCCGEVRAQAGGGGELKIEGHFRGAPDLPGLGDPAGRSDSFQVCGGGWCWNHRSQALLPVRVFISSLIRLSFPPNLSSGGTLLSNTKHGQGAPVRENPWTFHRDCLEEADLFICLPAPGSTSVPPGLFSQVPCDHLTVPVGIFRWPCVILSAVALVIRSLTVPSLVGRLPFLLPPLCH